MSSPNADIECSAARLYAKPLSERRVAIVLADSPNRDRRIDNEVGHDIAQSAVMIVRALREAGYRTGDMPEDGAALMDRLLSGPTTARPHVAAEETLSFAEYSAFFASLPPLVQQRVTERWGAAERDPFFRPGRLDCGHYAIAGFRCGNVAVLIQPARDYKLDPEATWHDPALAPPHFFIATQAWLTDSFRADAIIDLGKHEATKWLSILVERR